MSRLILATEVLAGDVTRRELARAYRKVHRNVYAPLDLELTARDRAIAAWLWSGRTATVSGLSAAAVLGSKWVPADAPAELVRAQHDAPAGIIVRKDTISEDEICAVDGIPCTGPARTGFDLGRRLPFDEALIRIDALLSSTRIAPDAIANLSQRYPGARNIRRLREIVDIADGGAESPQETRVRLILLRGGLPRPQTQIAVGWRRIDMGWPQWKVGVEYDGVQHWSDPRTHGGDVERLELFAELGWRIVRVVAEHVRHDPASIAGRAAKALRSAGWDGELQPRELAC